MIRTPVHMAITSSFAIGQGEDPICPSQWDVRSCEWRMRANVSVSKCGCVPIHAVPYLPPNQYLNIPICGCIHNQTCKGREEMTNLAEEQPCLRMCHKKLYSMFIITEPFNDPKEITGNVVLSIQMSNDTYPVFTEQRKSQVEFLSELGGMIDLWLGASVIGILHLFVFGIKQLFYMCNKNTKTSQQVRHMMSHFTSGPTLAAVVKRSTTGDFGEEDGEDIDELKEKVHNLEQKVDDLIKATNQNF